MAAEGDILYELQDRVARITINRPARRNSLTWSAIDEMRHWLEVAKADPAVRVVVVTGAGDQAFCAGADLSGMSAGGTEPELHERRGTVAALFEDLWALGKPTIAMVRGFALAGGFGLALSCDLVVCSDDSIFGAPEIDIGLWPFMVTVPMVRSMPPKKALELMLTGRRVDASEAEQIGFVTRVVPPDELEVAVGDLAAILAAKPPAAMRLGRDSFYAVWDMAAAEALACLHPLLTVATSTEDARKGMEAFAARRRQT